MMNVDAATGIPLLQSICLVPAILQISQPEMEGDLKVDGNAGVVLQLVAAYPVFGGMLLGAQQYTCSIPRETLEQIYNAIGAHLSTGGHYHADDEGCSAEPMDGHAGMLSQHVEVPDSLPEDWGKEE
jgi:hypothetical protein